MSGNPRASCGTTPSPLDSGIEYTAVPLVGTSLFGGLTPKATHSSNATNIARSAGFGSVGLRYCWQVPTESGGAPVTVCSTLESMKKRTLSGSEFRSFPVGSVCKSEPAFTQYSLAELTSKALGQVNRAASIWLSQRRERQPLAVEPRTNALCRFFEI